MIIYTYLDSAPLLSQGPWVRAWERSWRKQGWTTRLLTRRIAEKHSQFFPDLAKLHKWCALAMQKERGYYSSIFTINQGLKASALPSDVYFPVNGPALAMRIVSLDDRAVKFGAIGWTLSELVSFEGLPIDELYESGMRL